MQIIFGLLTFFFGIIIILAITLFIWDKFLKKDDSPIEAGQIMTGSDKSLKAGYTAEEDKPIIDEGERIMKENETIDEFELMEVSKRK